MCQSCPIINIHAFNNRTPKYMKQTERNEWKKPPLFNILLKSLVKKKNVGKKKKLKVRIWKRKKVTQFLFVQYLENCMEFTNKTIRNGKS